eukprot:scaffold2420_cov259-Pinguiococcus_pyrenoidosus.AAC.20
MTTLASRAASCTSSFRTLQRRKPHSCRSPRNGDAGSTRFEAMPKLGCSWCAKHTDPPLIIIGSSYSFAAPSF